MNSRVVQLLGPSAGGIRAHVAALVERLGAHGVDPTVLGPPGVMEHIGPQDGVVRVPAVMSPVGLLRARGDLRPWRARCDLIHVHGLKAGWTAIGGRPRRPLVATVHNVVLSESSGALTGVQRILERRVLGSMDIVIALTSPMASSLSDVVPAERLKVVLPTSNPPVVQRDRLAVRRSLGVEDDAPLVVTVARLHPQKDLATLLRAWRTVTSVEPAARLRIVGDGPLRGDLQQMIDELGIGPSACLVGQSPHAVDELAAADVVVMTSIWEGASIAFAEATQLGVPIVSTPTGNAPDVLKGGVGGTIVPVGDPDAVAEAVLGFLSDPEHARSVGERGRQRARRVFDPDRSVSAVAQIYREVLQ